MVTRPPRQVPPPTRPDGDQPRGPSYSRIIPREELSGFAAWNPGALEGGLPPRRPPVSAPAPVEPPPPPSPPEPSIDELLHAARQAGYQDGYRDGMSALDAFKQSFAKQISAQVGALVTSFDADMQGIEREMAESLARTAVELARQVVRHELATEPELIAQVAHDAVEALLISARHVRVRVHPDDLQLVLDGAGEELRAREAQVIPDFTIARGGCKVDADICSVDASLQARWQAAVSALGQTSVWEDRRSIADEAPRQRHGGRAEALGGDRDNGREMGRDPARDPGRDIARETGREMGRDSGRDLSRDLPRDGLHGSSRDHGHDFDREDRESRFHHSRFDDDTPA